MNVHDHLALHRARRLRLPVADQCVIAYEGMCWDLRNVSGVGLKSLKGVSGQHPYKHF